MIAEALNRSPATISRELRRNGTRGQYFAAQAQERSQRRRRQRPIIRRMEQPGINLAVRQGLSQYWSPEQIAGRLKFEGPQEEVPLTARTIYSWIEGDAHREHWRSFLRRRGKRPFLRKKPDRMGDPIKGRPEIIEKRLRLGDFEGDTVLGPPGTGGLATLVDRKSRFTIVVKIRSKDANHVHRKIKERMKQLHEEKRHSITFDNGTEFARCRRLEKHLGMELYFAEPGRPHQRGTNENTNGLIRQFFPKGTDFRNVTHDEVREVENLLNKRPRKCLGYRTPREVFFEFSASENCI
jgi:IS30 family transposase